MKYRDAAYPDMSYAFGYATDTTIYISLKFHSQNMDIDDEYYR